ncbi:hypothetical protein ACIO1C_17115 [Streptomyces sp. NPDC087420]|uniref:hypothetical protein n=1 Tax=Streptomyces sp. NPDC087420 TaxID=3365785 RepID=UPI0038371FA6
MGLRRLLSTVAVLGGLLVSGCTSSDGASSPADPSASGDEFDPSYMQRIMDSQLDRGVSELRAGVVHRPKKDRPLGISPCRLVELDRDVRITDAGAATRKAVPVPALYELRSERYDPGFSVSVYLLPRRTDTSELLAEVLTAARDCGPRTADAPLTALSRSQAPVTTVARATAGKHGPGVAVLSDARYRAAPPSPGPGWTIGPDGKLAPVGELPRASRPPLTPTDTSVEYGQAVVYGTNGRFLVEVLKVAEESLSAPEPDPTPAPGGQPSGPTYTEAQEILTTVLTGFQGVPE